MIYMRKDIKKASTISVFLSSIIVLQTIASFVKIGSFPITLTLIPIVVGGAIYGRKAGFLLGITFGVVVDVMVIVGVDPGGAAMLSTRPVVTLVTCLIKGGLCGYLGALSYELIKNNKTGIIVDAVVTPVVNTATLYISLIMFFDSSLSAMLGAFMSVNFVIELIINVLIAPGLLIVIQRQKERG